MIDAHLPYHPLQVDHGRPESRQVTIRFRSLPWAHGPGGRVYHSRRQPTIRVDGRELVVGFSEHALRQVYERTAFDWRTYAGADHASMYLGSCDYFEDVSHLFGDPCFAVFGPCVPGHVGGQLARSALGRAVEVGDRLYYRVGYCPAVVEGRFLKAKTLLLPGMKGTPESRAVAAARLTPAERTEFGSRFEAFAAAGRRGADMLGVLLDFHRLGVSQVVRIDRPVFHFD